MTIPLVDLKAQYGSIKDEIDSAMRRVVESTGFILGPEVEAFEQEFAAYCGTRHAIGTCSGTSALHLAMLACGIGPGDEVITTPFTFIATASVITQVGARPVFVDIDQTTYNIDPAKIEAAITPRTKAILPVHLYGQPAEMDAILDIAAKHNLAVIEDAAQAHGARYRGQRVGGFGRLAIFSFYPSKNLGAYGDGGAIVTNDSTVAEKVRLLHDHGRRGKYEHLVEGYNYRLDALQAAILRVKLGHLDEWNARRRANATIYRQLLASSGLGLPVEADNIEHAYHLFVVRSPQRDELHKHLKAASIDTGIHYPTPLHLQPAYDRLSHRPGDFPIAEAAAREVLSLPMYAELSPTQMEKIVAAVEAFAANR